MSAQHTLPERYEVTRDGRVLSFVRWPEMRELSQEMNDDGYPCVRVVINGRRRRVPVHKLVAQQFHGPQPAPGYEVRHLDGNKLNPHADNLEWGTRKQNAEDRERHGRTSRGEKHSTAIKARAPFKRPKGIAPSNKGKPMGDAQKQKLSEAMRGKPWSEARRAALAKATGSAS